MQSSLQDRCRITHLLMAKTEEDGPGDSNAAPYVPPRDGQISNEVLARMFAAVHIEQSAFQM
jgi:hypothetical protein